MTIASLDPTTCDVYAADGGSGAMLVLAHGAGAGRRHPFMTAIARGLAARGVDVVTFDFPYMTEKRRVPDRAPVLEAHFRSLVESARALERYATHRVFIGGKSMGGRIATHLGAAGLPVAGIVALGYPLHPPGKPLQLRDEHLPAIEAPLLVVQGERDTFGTPEELEPVIRRMRAPVTLRVVDGGDHSFAVRGRERSEAWDVVAGWVAAWMGAPADAAV